MKRRWPALIVVLLVAVGGGLWWFLKTDPLSAVINAAFPPITMQEQRAKASTSALSTLLAMKDANFAASLDLATLEGVLKGDKRLPAVGAKAVSLSADQQLMHVQIDFDRTFTANEVELDPAIAKIIAEAKPNIRGRISAYFGVTSNLSQADQDNGLLRLKLLPVYDRITVDRVTVAGDSSGTPIVQAIVGLLNRYADNLTGIVSALPFTDIVVPPTLVGPSDPSRRFPTSTKNGAKVDVTLLSRPVSAPMSLTAVAWVLHDNRVSVFANFSPNKESPSAHPPPANPSSLTDATAILKQISDAAERHMSLLVGDQRPTASSWLAISKNLVARSLTDILNQARPCVSVTAQLPRDSFENEIRFPDESTIQCSPTRDCSTNHIKCDPTRNCDSTRNCTANSDTRECSRRALGISYNDPTCEAAKAAQNKAYELAKGACEAQKASESASCEATKSLEKDRCEASKKAWSVDCERIKAQDKGVCELEKEAIKRLARTGKFGRLSGTYEGHAEMKLCVPAANFGDNLERAQIALEVTGSADIDAKIKFVPLDIVGHLACQAPWSESERLDVAIPLQTLNISATITFDSNEPFWIRFKTSDIELKSKLDPDPTELLLRSNNFQISCSALAGALTIGTVLAKPFIKELQGQFKYTFKSDELAVRPDLPTQKINGQEVKLAIKAGGPALVLTAK